MRMQCLGLLNPLILCDVCIEITSLTGVLQGIVYKVMDDITLIKSIVLCLTFFYINTKEMCHGSQYESVAPRLPQNRVK